MIQPLAGSLSPLGAARKRSSSLLVSLVSYWKLDESSTGVSLVTRSDSVGTNHLTDVGNNPSETGILGNAVRIDGSANHYLQCASNASLQTGYIDFEVNLWVKFYALSGNNVIAGKTNAFGSTAGTEWFVGINSSNKVFLRVSDGSGFTSQTSTTTITTGVWYNVAAWHDSISNTVGVQINGGSAETSVALGAVAVNTSPFRIGTGSGASGQTINAAVDEIGFWKRILTSAERAARYNAGAGNTHPF